MTLQLLWKARDTLGVNNLQFRALVGEGYLEISKTHMGPLGLVDTVPTRDVEYLKDEILKQVRTGNGPLRDLVLEPEKKISSNQIDLPIEDFEGGIACWVKEEKDRIAKNKESRRDNWILAFICVVVFVIVLLVPYLLR